LIWSHPFLTDPPGWEIKLISRGDFNYKTYITIYYYTMTERGKIFQYTKPFRVLWMTIMASFSLFVEIFKILKYELQVTSELRGSDRFVL
jgi:hypothetical protein